MTEIYEPTATARQQTLTCEMGDKLVQVRGDKTLLGQMLANLIENALNHTPAGTKVTVRLSEAGGHPILDVTDTGPGIPPEEREKVLRRLYRLDRSRNTPGNGLGLSLVEGVARLHDAALSLDDNAPGLRVRIVFPGSDVGKMPATQP